MDDRLPPGFKDMLDFGLIDALTGRRSRRVFPGAEIPDGHFKYKSEHEPMPLSEIEQMTLLTAMAGNTGWHNLIMRNAHYAPHIANYAGTAGGRAFVSAAGFHTSELFFTDDDGVYVFQTRDAPDLTGRENAADLTNRDNAGDGKSDFERLLEAHRSRVRKIASGRMKIPPEPPYMEGHNTWVVNRPGSTLFIPVGDLAQHVLADLCYYVQNGSCIRDDVTGEPIEGLERFGHLVDLDNPIPLTFLELWSLAELTAELSTACFAGALTLQAMGLGGWMFDGLDPWTVLGASGNPDIPGLGFRYDTDDRWPFPNPTGLPGVFEGYCPPHYRDMRDAVEALARRKFGPGGPFNPDTPGPYKDTRGVRSRAQVHSEEFKECVALMAQHIYDRFGKFPGIVPGILVMPYLQAQHLELEFYDRFFRKGAYLPTHERHTGRWHSGDDMKKRL